VFNIGAGELTVIVLVALLVLGPDRLPGIARSAAKGYRELTRLRRQMDVSVKEIRDDLKIDIDPDDLNLEAAAPSLRAPQGERFSRGGTPAAPPEPVQLEVPELDDYLAGSGAVASPALLQTPAEDDYLGRASGAPRE
jgi:sec-independent protein translocase protein TatB